MGRLGVTGTAYPERRRRNSGARPPSAAHIRRIVRLKEGGEKKVMDATIHSGWPHHGQWSRFANRASGESEGGRPTSGTSRTYLTKRNGRLRSREESTDDQSTDRIGRWASLGRLGPQGPWSRKSSRGAGPAGLERDLWRWKSG